MIRKSLLALATLALAGTTALAADENTATQSTGPRMTTVTPGSGSKPYVPLSIDERGLSKIYSNVSKYSKARYWPFTGYVVSGPTSAAGFQQTMAEPFTPGADATVTAIEVGVGNIAGTNGVTVSLYSDADGEPGTSLASKVASNLPGFGGCCGLSKVKFKTGVAVTAGTTYWVVISTNDAQSDTWDATDIAVTDFVDLDQHLAYSNGGGWTVVATNQLFVLSVLGH